MSVPKSQAEPVVPFSVADCHRLAGGLFPVARAAGRGISDQAEDLVAETMARLWKIRHLVPTDATERLTYAKAVCRNVVHESWRRESRRRLREVPLDRRDDQGNAAAADVPDPGAVSIEDQMDHKQTLEALETTRRSLTPDERRLYELAFLDCRSHQQIADALGISVNASRTRLCRLVSKLRFALRGRIAI